MAEPLPIRRLELFYNDHVGDCFFAQLNITLVAKQVNNIG